jgi:hypothetical protein
MEKGGTMMRRPRLRLEREHLLRAPSSHPTEIRDPEKLCATDADEFCVPDRKILLELNNRPHGERRR